MMMPEEKIGPYRIVRKLGEGGMGAVFEAVHEAIERHVAIKVLHPEFAQDPEFIARFFNEARAVNRIDHPGLVQVSDYGQLPDKTAYIVMEYLKGETLGSRLKQKQSALALTEVLNLGCQLAETLAAAHDKGIIHRDLKPDNVIVVADAQMPGGERAKLLDFGIAKLVEEHGPQSVKTRTNSMMGTPYYMSPEQCRSAGTVDDRADVYSFGIMLYEMLGGRRPFTGESQGDIVLKQVTTEAPPLSDFAPKLPKVVIDLVHSMIAKKKEERPSMAEVAAELDALRTASPPPKRQSAALKIARTGRPSGTLTATASATAAGQQATIYYTDNKKRNVIRAAVVIAGLSMTGLVGYRLLRPSPHAPANPTPTVTAPAKVADPPPVAAEPPKVEPELPPLTELKPVNRKKTRPPKRDKGGAKSPPGRHDAGK